MQIVWTHRAIRHLTNLRSYIEQDKPEAAHRIAERIMTAAESLTMHPQKGRPGRRPGTRELVIPNTPYILPYRVKGERVVILAVLHGAQLR